MSTETKEYQTARRRVRGFINGYGIELKNVADLGLQTDDGWDHFAYELTLTNRYDRAQKLFTFSYKQGVGHTEPPTLADIVSALLSDAAYVLDRDFYEFAEDLGYNPDSRKAEQLYRQIVENNGKLTALFRHSLDDVLEKWEPLRDEAGL
jgi:hypothetical protein